ncbi:hypothetical protein ABIA39_004870 [Nocardia sp. GAS34]|uniref:hypothetical protein n=1 Tax=unclassified Nocardia TaxID=2637762 RepID=UPI003D203726
MSGGSLFPIEALAAGPIAPEAAWPLYFFGAFTVVAVVALCRAKRDDVPKIFAAFAAALGFRRLPRSRSTKRADASRGIPATGATEQQRRHDDQTQERA